MTFLLPLVLGYLGVALVGGQQLDPTNLPNLDNVNHTVVSDWMDTCEVMAGKEAVKDIKESLGKMLECLQDHINLDKLQREVEVSIKRGELDVVFKKYCKKRDQIMTCVEEMLVKVERCATDQQKKDLNITRKVIDAGIDFVCHNDGDRIALFMAEKGEQCLKNHTESILQCIEDRVPEVKKIKENPNSMDISSVTINEKNCKSFDEIHGCVVEYTSKCDDETPANILGSLITQMMKAMPCSQPNRASALLSHTQHLLPHLLTLLLAALTAANLLL